MPRVVMPVIADVRAGGTRYFVDNLELAFSASAAPVPTAEGSLIISDAALLYAELLHPGTAHYHLETDATTAAWTANLTLPDDAYIGLPGPGGRLAFDLTPAPDQLKVTDADVNFVTTAHGIIHIDGVAAGMILRADGTRYVPAAAAETLPIAPLAIGDTLLATAGPLWDILTTPSAAGYARVSTATTEAWNQTPVWTGLHTFNVSLVAQIDQNATTEISLINADVDVTAAAFYRAKNTAAAGGNNALSVGVLGTGFTTAAPAYQDSGMIQTGPNLSGGLTIRTLADVPVYFATAATRVNMQVSSAGLVVNPGGADLDTQIQALGVADAFEIDGATGQITMGALGTGLVKSTAGILSIGAAGDLPAHTHSGAAQGGSLVIGTTDTDATLGSVLFAGVAGVIQQDNANLFWDNAADELGIRTTAPDGPLHVHTASAGAVTASALANVGVFENSTDGGISILTPNLGTGRVIFGTPSNNTGARLAWDYTNDEFKLATTKATADISFNPGTGSDAMIIRSGTQIDIVEYLRHHNDPDTFWRFQTDRASLDCGGVTMMDAVEGASDYVRFGASVGVGIVPTAPLHVYEDTTAVDATAGLLVEQDGTGDAIVQFFLTGARRWVAGIDNSDSNKFKIASDADLNTNTHFTITTAGRVGIGTTGPATSALLELASTVGALLVPRMTTAQRNALTAVNGMIIYNSSTAAFNFREAGAWVTGSGLA